MKLTRAEAQILEQNADTPAALRMEIRRKLDASEGSISVKIRSGDINTVERILNPHKRPRGGYTNWIVAFALAGSLFSAGSGGADAHRIDTCAAARDVFASGQVDELAIAMNAVGCDLDTLQRQGVMCNRLASRLVHKALHEGDSLNVDEIAETVERASSNGHDCVQYEDGSYGFPDLSIDCLVDPRC